MKNLFFSLFAVSLIATGCASESTPDTAAVPDAAETSEAMPDDMEGMDMEGMDMEGMYMEGMDMEGMESSSEGDFEFALASLDSPVATGDAELMLAVKDATTGEPVATDNLTVDVYMMMEGDEKMATESEVVAGEEPGMYQVNTYLSMEGPWVVHAVVDEGGQEGVGHLMLEAQ